MRLEFVYRHFVDRFQLILQQLVVSGAKHNQSTLLIGIRHFTQATAGSLQHEVAGCRVARQGNGGEAVAIPPFPADSHQQDHALTAVRAVQIMELC